MELEHVGKLESPHLHLRTIKKDYVISWSITGQYRASHGIMSLLWVHHHSIYKFRPFVHEFRLVETCWCTNSGTMQSKIYSPWKIDYFCWDWPSFFRVQRHIWAIYIMSVEAIDNIQLFEKFLEGCVWPSKRPIVRKNISHFQNL